MCTHKSHLVLVQQNAQFAACLSRRVTPGPGAAAEATAGQAGGPEADELRMEAVRLRAELEAAAERAAGGAAAAAELKRVRRAGALSPDK